MNFFKSLFGGDYVTPMCVEKSFYAALAYAMQRKVPVRTVVSRFKGKPGTDHAQAQAWLEGKWEWLQVGSIGVQVGIEDRFGSDYGEKEHYKLLTLDQLAGELKEKGFMDNEKFKLLRDLDKFPER